jgi:chemotaxis protein methyltransferase CheR
MTSSDYNFLSALLHSHSGLSLGMGKEYLLESRLPPVVQNFGFQSLDEMIMTLRVRPHQQLVKAVCDAMMTGETMFFRDTVPFDLLRDRIFPELVARCRDRGTPMRIWSAAASTGQEAYSVAMLVSELEDLFFGVPVDILATDYAAQPLNRARRGVYSQIEVQRGLPVQFLLKYFTRTDDGYRISEDIRRCVKFREFNLLDPYGGLGKFDLILCRNVLIYFDAALKKDVMERMADVLYPGGYFFLGGTETSFGVTEKIVRLPDASTSVHIRREDFEAARDAVTITTSV